MSLPDIGTVGNWKYTDIENPPPRELLPESHQVWVWIQGPGDAHFEVRGTGLIVPERDDDTLQERINARIEMMTKNREWPWMQDE